MKRCVTEQHLNKPLIWRPVLKALGVHSRDILATAAAYHSVVLHVAPNVLTLSALQPKSHICNLEFSVPIVVKDETKKTHPAGGLISVGNQMRNGNVNYNMH